MRARIILPLLSILSLLLPLRPAAAERYGVKVVVLDAGHGGGDAGAHYAGTSEKDLTLKVVLRLGRRIEQGMPGVRVVYTRTTDKALAPTKIEDLQKRADIANKAEGDLFVSVHVNAARSTSAYGVETLVMGETPKEQRYNENALFQSNRDDLLDMSDAREAAIIRAYIQNLQFTYGEYSMAMARCIQKNYTAAGRHSRGIKPQLLRVLYATNMPGVLTEIGFLSNAEEAAFLKSEKGIDKIVDALYRSVCDYSDYVLGVRGAEEAEAAAAPAEKPAETPAKKPAEKPAESSPAAAPAAPSKPAASAQPAAPKAEAKSEPKKGAKSGAGKDAKPAAAAEVRYTVQVLASTKSVGTNSAEFKSYRGRVRCYRSDGTFRYKYGVGEYKTRAEALEAAAAVRRTFPKAFVTAVQGDRVVTPPAQ